MRLIDADKLLLDTRKYHKGNESLEQIIDEAKTVNAIPIPKGAANEQMCRFLKGIILDINTKVPRYNAFNYNSYEEFEKDWKNYWNAPYKEG